LYGKDDAEIAVQLARHFQEAGTTGQAADYLNQAGDRARGLYAHQEAINSYQQAISAYQRALGERWDPLQQAELEYKIGEALFWKGDHRLAAEHLEKSLEYLAAKSISKVRKTWVKKLKNRKKLTLNIFRRTEITIWVSSYNISYVNLV
jgi:tetratricopeptide (TPR) repeat protein